MYFAQIFQVMDLYMFFFQTEGDKQWTFVERNSWKSPSEENADTIEQEGVWG